MEEIILRVETHVHAEGQLQDHILDESLGDDIDSCGIVGPEIIIFLRKNRNPRIRVAYTDSTTLQDIVNLVYNQYGFHELDEFFRPSVAFLHGGIRYWIDNKNAKFKPLVENHLDSEKTGEISVAIYVNANAGCICEDEGIRYYMNSRERGKHNEPHIHLCSVNSCQEAVIIIRTREIIGEFPRKLKKKAKENVAANERFFLEQWNVLTDGLKVDINRYFGLVNY